MTATKYVEQPGVDAELELNNIIDNGVSKVKIPGTNRSYNIRWLKHESTRKITRVLLQMKEGDDDKISCKVAAVIVLNDFWKIKFLYWIVWRWFYYVRQYVDAQLLPLIMEGKKKVQQGEFYSVTMLLIGMKDTIMTMTKAEIDRFLQEQHGGQRIT